MNRPRNATDDKARSSRLCTINFLWDDPVLNNDTVNTLHGHAQNVRLRTKIHEICFQNKVVALANETLEKVLCKMIAAT